MNEAELITKKKCPDLPQSTKSSECPDGYIKYKEKCIKVSIPRLCVYIYVSGVKLFVIFCSFQDIIG